MDHVVQHGADRHRAVCGFYAPFAAAETATCGTAKGGINADSRPDLPGNRFVSGFDGPAHKQSRSRLVRDPPFLRSISDNKCTLIYTREDDFRDGRAKNFLVAVNLGRLGNKSAGPAILALFGADNKCTLIYTREDDFRRNRAKSFLAMSIRGD
jgi:hypothetical protein